MERKSKILQVESIDVYYGKKHIVKSISANYYKNDIVLLVGPNGAGKSTYLKAIAGILRHKNGKVFLKGRDISNTEIEERVKKGIAHLLQTNNIFPNNSVLENLQIAGYFLKREEFESMLEKVFLLFPVLKEKTNRLAGLLSGGERQALAISLILLKKPKVLLLDEPLAGLSPKTSKEFISFLPKVFELFDVETVCFVEHNLKLSLEYANRVQVLVQGRIYMDAPVREDKEALIEKIESLYFGEVKEIEKKVFNS